MAAHSSIEWTGATWNPVTGCSKISLGCRNCYAERIAKRLQAMAQPNYACGFRVALHERMLPLPLKWKKPQIVFVNSMSDLFHEEVSTAFIHRVFEVMNRAPWHVFQILTKRSERLLELNAELSWAEHIWMGVTVEAEDYLFRMDHLRATGAVTKFVSFEPLLGPLPELDLEGIGWVIVGGESGPGARPMRRQWVVDIRDRCHSMGIPFFFKQWGGTRRRAAGRLLDGRTWDEMPPLPAGSLPLQLQLCGGQSPGTTAPGPRGST